MPAVFGREWLAHFRSGEPSQAYSMARAADGSWGTPRPVHGVAGVSFTDLVTDDQGWTFAGWKTDAGAPEDDEWFVGWRPRDGQWLTEPQRLGSGRELSSVMVTGVADQSPRLRLLSADRERTALYTFDGDRFSPAFEGPTATAPSELPLGQLVSEDGELYWVQTDLGVELDRRRVGAFEGISFAPMSLRNDVGDLIVLWEQYAGERYRIEEMNCRTDVEPFEVDEGCVRSMIYAPYELWAALWRGEGEPVVTRIAAPPP